MNDTRNSTTPTPARARKSAIDPNAHFAYKKSLAEKIRAKESEIREWYCSHARQAPPPLYCSVDLRDSGVKIVPVDSNLYPAGFNNVCPDDQRAAPPIFREQLLARAARDGASDPKKVLILPESHTSNRWYLENLFYLRQIIEQAGFEVRIGWLPTQTETPPGPSAAPVDAGASAKQILTTATDKTLEVESLAIREGLARTEGFTPDVIVLNNDYSGGYPEILDRIRQPILPTHRMGWHSRKKSEHFKHYNRLAAEFAAIIGVDPWIIQIETEEVDGVNFNDEIGIDRVASAAERILTRTREHYAAHGVKSEPFVFVKNNAGTYGMGIMVVKSADELRTMNRRTKNKMSVGKNKRQIDSIAVQEGVPTATLVDRLASEPVIYLFGAELIGGFLRTNTERGTEDNLNSQGMVFRKLCMSDLRDDSEDESLEETALELVYGSVARLSALATGIELKERLGAS